MTDEEAIQAAQSIHAQNRNAPESNPQELNQWLKTMNLESVASHPLGQVGITLLKDQDFRKAYGEIHQSFQLNLVSAYVGGWVLLIWIIRAWRLSKASTWLTRIWTQLWVSNLAWWGVFFLIPWLLWGKSYQILLATVVRAMIHQFWA